MEAGQNGKFAFNKQVYRDLGLCGERGGFIRENAGKSPGIGIKICVLPLLFTRARVTMLMQVGRLLVRIN